jgi:hypothetical protein
MKAVLYDFESCIGNNSGESRIFNVCLIPVDLNPKTREVTKLTGVLICVKDVLKREEIKENTRVRQKVGRAVFDGATNNMNIKYLTFHDFVKSMITFVIEKGDGNLLGHNLLGDLGFLSSTQDFVGGKRIVKKKLKDYPSTGVYDPRWSQLNLMCTMSLFGTRCPKMAVAYQKFNDDNNISRTPGGYYSSKLETYTKFARNDPKYEQSHSVVQDTVDLYIVLKMAYKCGDTNLIDGADYLVRPDWVRAAK